MNISFCAEDAGNLVRVITDYFTNADVDSNVYYLYDTTPHYFAQSVIEVLLTLNLMEKWSDIYIYFF